MHGVDEDSKGESKPLQHWTRRCRMESPENLIDCCTWLPLALADSCDLKAWARHTDCISQCAKCAKCAKCSEFFRSKVGDPEISYVKLFFGLQKRRIPCFALYISAACSCTFNGYGMEFPRHLVHSRRPERSSSPQAQAIGDLGISVHRHIESLQVRHEVGARASATTFGKPHTQRLKWFPQRLFWFFVRTSLWNCGVLLLSLDQCPSQKSPRLRVWTAGPQIRRLCVGFGRFWEHYMPFTFSLQRWRARVPLTSYIQVLAFVHRSHDSVIFSLWNS